MTRICDGCRSSNASMYCTADMAYMCLPCDLKIHAANKLSSRHERVWICEVCEHAPAAVICKADAAALCSSCDLDIHSANPLANRHERVPVTPFFDCPSMIKVAHINASSVVPNAPELILTGQEHWAAGQQFAYLEQNRQETQENQSPIDPFFTAELLECNSGSFGFQIGEQSRSAAVVPESSSMSDISNPYVIDYLCQINNNHGRFHQEARNLSTREEQQGPSIGRQERVMRYREKKKNRKFEKTVRYASRKAYAEIRPRVKGRFVKRAAADVVEQFIIDSVVPSF